MKKISLFAMLLALCLCFLACSDEKERSFSELLELKDVAKIGIIYSWSSNSALISDKDTIDSAVSIFCEMTLSPTEEGTDIYSGLFFTFYSNPENNPAGKRSVLVDKNGILSISGDTYKITSDFKYDDLYQLYESNLHNQND